MQQEGSLSHRVAKSQEEMEARPDTPNFTQESESSEGNDNDQEQKDQIRAHMEAQIQGFDDDN